LTYIDHSKILKIAENVQREGANSHSTLTQRMTLNLLEIGVTESSFNIDE